MAQQSQSQPPHMRVVEDGEGDERPVDQFEFVGSLVDDLDLIVNSLSEEIEEIKSVTEPRLAAHQLKVNLPRIVKAYEVLADVVARCRKG